MALPTILFNSSTGSDTAASGAGPSTALSGNGASCNATTSVDLSANSPDLSGVATDGSACLWVDTASGRQYSRITNTNNTTKIVTVATAYGVTASGLNWAIGGKRATLDHADSRTLGADVESQWIIQIEDDGAGAITGSAWPLSSAAVPVKICGDSTTTKRLITQSANAACIAISGLCVVDIQNLIFENTNGTKTSARGCDVSVSANVRFRNCRFGHATNTLLNGVARTNNTPILLFHDCEVLRCTAAGIAARTIAQCFGCYIHDNTGHGISFSAGNSTIVCEDCVIESNGSGGILLETTIGMLIVRNCTIHGNTGDGIDFTANANSSMANAIIFNNNITANGGYGIRGTGVGASTGPVSYADFNNFGTGATANTSGSTLNVAAGDNDLAVDPGYADAANGDFAAGTNIKAKGFPAATRDLGSNPSSGTTAYNDIGISRQEAGGGGGGFIIGG